MPPPYPSAGEICAFLAAEVPSTPAITVTHVTSIQQAAADSLIFAADAAALAVASASIAGLILAPFTSTPGPRIVRVREPRTAFAQVYARWFAPVPSAHVHPTASISPAATLGSRTSVGPGAVISDDVIVGSDCVLGARVVLYPGTRLGDRVHAKAGAVLGSPGFGFARTTSGYVSFPQIGTLWIGDDVEIGANSTIDRGALGETRIGRGSKIDNLVHIAHNCRIGEDVIIAAQTGMAGSCIVDDGAMLGGQVGLGEDVTIGAGVMLGGQGGVLPGKKLEGPGEVFWGTPARPVREYLRDLARLRKR